MELKTRIIDGGAPIHCEECGSEWRTLKEEGDTIIVGCPNCGIIEEEDEECVHPNLTMTEFGDYCEDCGWEDDITGSNLMGG